MAYEKTIWMDEVLSGLERFEILQDGGGGITAFGDFEVCRIRLETEITTPGTAVNAANLNKIEDELEYLHNKTLYRSVQLIVYDRATDVAISASAAWLPIPAIVDGWKVVRVEANTGSTPPSGTLTLNVVNAGNAILSADLSFTAVGYSASTSINSTYEEVSAGDQLIVNVKAAGGAKGLTVTITFEEA